MGLVERKERKERKKKEKKRKEGRKGGREGGRKEGRKEGRKDGRKEGRASYQPEPTLLESLKPRAEALDNQRLHGGRGQGPQGAKCLSAEPQSAK
jgi:flagellar biosynthesis/type III secretory pathway protein FliH